jgi:hypothetical protein
MADLTEQQARALVAPRYELFNIATCGDVRAVQEAVLTKDSPAPAISRANARAARRQSRWSRISRAPSGT